MRLGVVKYLSKKMRAQINIYYKILGCLEAVRETHEGVETLRQLARQRDKQNITVP